VLNQYDINISSIDTIEIIHSLSFRQSIFPLHQAELFQEAEASYSGRIPTNPTLQLKRFLHHVGTNRYAVAHSFFSTK
jgi:hypothetical protein